MQIVNATTALEERIETAEAQAQVHTMHTMSNNPVDFHAEYLPAHITASELKISIVVCGSSTFDSLPLEYNRFNASGVQASYQT